MPDTTNYFCAQGDAIMTVEILTDSTSYIQKEIREELEIKIVSLNVIFDDGDYRESDLNNESFYEIMKEKGIPKSSQPSVDELYNAMKNVVEKGNELFCIFLSSDMSGTYSTAHMVKDMILEEYKEAKIEIMDSRSNSMQLGFIAVLAAKAAKSGNTLAQIKHMAQSNIKRSRFLFVPNNLEYLKKGGRIGGASALIGNFLKIVPILTVENGKTTILMKIRTKKKAITTMIDKMLQDIDEYGLGEVIVHHINCYDEAKELADIIGDRLNINVKISAIGPVIGLHVGPGTVAVAYYTQRDIRG